MSLRSHLSQVQTTSEKGLPNKFRLSFILFPTITQNIKHLLNIASMISSLISATAVTYEYGLEDLSQIYTKMLISRKVSAPGELFCFSSYKL